MLIAVALLIATSIVLAGSAAAAPPPAGTITPTQALTGFEAAHPELLVPSLQAAAEGQQLAPALAPAPGSDTGIAVSGTLNDSTISGFPQDGFSVSSPDGAFAIIPVGLDGAVSQATLVNGASVLFANVQPSTDLLLRPTPLGVERSMLLRASDAPQSFSWQVSVGADQRLVQLSDGSVAITDPMISPAPPPLPVPSPGPAPPLSAPASSVMPHNAEQNSVPGGPAGAPEPIASPPVATAQTADLGHGCLVQAVGQLLTGLSGLPPIISSAVQCPQVVLAQITGDLQQLLGRISQQPGCTIALIGALQGLLSNQPGAPNAGSCAGVVDSLTSTLKAPSASLGGGPADTAASYTQASQQLAAAETQTSDSTAALLAAPRAVDANGSPVPTSFSVADDQVTLTIQHTSGMAYPILVNQPVSGVSAAIAAAAKIAFKPTYGLSDGHAATFTEPCPPAPTSCMLPPGRTETDAHNWDKLRANLPVRDARAGLGWAFDTDTTSDLHPTTPCAPTFTCSEDDFVRQVIHEGLRPYLNLSISSRGLRQYRLPASPTDFRTHFEAIVNHFYQLTQSLHAAPIKLWQPWNEPNNNVHGKMATAQQAADWWREAHDVLMKFCDAHHILGCRVIAGEFARGSASDYGPRGYITEYGNELLHRVGNRLPTVAYPKIWSFHPYTDMIYGWRNRANHVSIPYRYPQQIKAECTRYLTGIGYPFQQTDCYVNRFAGRLNNGWDQGSKWHHPHIWLTEEGDELRDGPSLRLGGPSRLTDLDYKSCGPEDRGCQPQLDPNYPAELGKTLAGQRQVDAAHEFLAFAGRYNPTTRHGPVPPATVERVYYYAFGPGGGSGFDSALLDWAGPDPKQNPPGHFPRPVFCVLTRTAPTATNCPGARTAGVIGDLYPPTG